MYMFLRNLFFPKHCKGCGRYGVALCDTCISQIPFAQPFEEEYLYAVFDYGDPLVRDAIGELKYHRHASTARALVAAAAPHIAEYIAEKLQSISTQTLFLVPIPQHSARHTDRGYNQSLLIATWLSPLLENARVEEVLEKHSATLPQARLSRTMRLRNLAHTMHTKDTLDAKKVYIVIDDVTTTGATCAEARRALRAGGAKKILCIALAHGYARK